MASAALIDEVAWPLRAASVQRMLSTRSWRARRVTDARFAASRPPVAPMTAPAALAAAATARSFSADSVSMAGDADARREAFSGAKFFGRVLSLAKQHWRCMQGGRKWDTCTGDGVATRLWTGSG